MPIDELPSSSDFQKLDLRGFYSDTGKEIFESFVYPVLTNSVSYDRLTGFFSISALVAAAKGLEGLFRNKGRMRLVIGIHDVPEDLLGALALGNLLPVQLVEDYKTRILYEVGFLTNQAEKNALSTVGWMIRSGLLEVRVAAPRNSFGIYHQKRMIFRDGLEQVIVGTGSLNETFGGQGNIEEMQFNFSWLSSAELITPLVDSFEDIWEGRAESVEIFALDESFATRILSRLGNPTNPLPDHDSRNQGVAKEVLRLARSSPMFVPFNLSTAALYPHQERVFIQSLSRWPVRVMLADEVGLGKTLEAGAAISYMTRFCAVDSVTILAPAGLLRQWQDEMQKHFNLNFWRWEPSTKSYVSPDKSKLEVGFLGSENILPPKLRLVSTQWARIHEASLRDSLPQMLLVDEAHAARVHIDQYGTRTTKLWNLLNNLKDQVPHLVLLTATPMQVQPAEYHGLLKVLGLAPEWDDFQNYELSLRLISQTTDRPTLQDGAELADLILTSVAAHDWLPSHLTESELVLIMNLREAAGRSAFDKSSVAQESFPEYRKVLMKIHPAHFLTCRNTKTGLEEFGYRFPERVFHAPKVSMDGVLGEFESAVETYLSEAYGDVETALRPHGKFSIGFAKSGYYQRMVSSFFASKQSLLKRIEKIKGIQSALNSGDFSLISAYFDGDEDEIDDQNDEEIVNSFRPESLSSQEIEMIVAKVNQASRLELSYISDLLAILNSLGQDVVQSDPKFKAAMESLKSYVRESPVLVFSRYTDTLEGLLTLFEQSELPGRVRGYALYTGQNVWIQTAVGRREANKSDVTDALDSGAIEIVFCSDAASEGLNLQSARCILNLDVPWNPARLEQRIGRIARLGQKARQVHIVNFWYPKSIEAKMYSRLLSRRDDYQLAVGEFPQIFSSAIRDEVASVLDRSSIANSNPLVELQDVRNSFQRIALEAVWKLKEGDLPPSQVFRSDLIDFIRRAADLKPEWAMDGPLTASPGERESVTLWHELLDQAVEVPSMPLGDDVVELVGFESQSQFLGFATRSLEGKIRVIKSLSLARLLQATLGLCSLEERDFTGQQFGIDEIFGMIGTASKGERWLPNHDDSKVPYEGAVPARPWTVSNDIQLRNIGQICVRSQN